MEKVIEQPDIQLYAEFKNKESEEIWTLVDFTIAMKAGEHSVIVGVLRKSEDGITTDSWHFNTLDGLNKFFEKASVITKSIPGKTINVSTEFVSIPKDEYEKENDNKDKVIKALWGIINAAKNIWKAAGSIEFMNRLRKQHGETEPAKSVWNAMVDSETLEQFTEKLLGGKSESEQAREIMESKDYKTLMQPVQED